jgi:DNA-binding LacI/PurR family transcriptional regulator
MSPSDQIPARISLIDQAAAVLRVRLERGEWTAHLPGEIELARRLQVGRNTVRAALTVLEKEGRLRTVVGRRREVVQKVKKARQPSQKVAVLLLPFAWQSLPPATLLWMDALRSRLQGAGWEWQVVVEAAAFRRASAALLESLTNQHPLAVWILYRSTATMQRWFERNHPKTVIAGSSHAGVTLAQVDIDYRATCRHAAARMLGLGHKRLAVLAPAVSFPGDEESLSGFREGARGSTVDVLPIQDTKASVIQALRALLRSSERPTALFTFEARHAATALTHLSNHGVSLPTQMSLISRSEDPFLTYLIPEPARYERKPEAFAKKLAHLVSAIGRGMPIKQQRHLLIPSFVRGETLSRAPVPQKNKWSGHSAQTKEPLS